MASSPRFSLLRDGWVIRQREGGGCSFGRMHCNGGEPSKLCLGEETHSLDLQGKGPDGPLFSDAAEFIHVSSSLTCPGSCLELERQA
jgi:hypothetical protein